jgi:phosphoribosylformylglycinamidine synthase subunit PurS
VKRRFEIVVTLKEGLLDPEGKTIQDALPTMGWTNVSDVRVGKHIELTVDTATEEEATSLVREMAERLLSNPVIEDFRVLTTRGVQGGSSPGDGSLSVQNASGPPDKKGGVRGGSSPGDGSLSVQNASGPPDKKEEVR